jgi:hypothetical protein
MLRRKRGLILIIAAAILLLALLAWQFIIVPDTDVPDTVFHEAFDSAGSWIVGQDATAEGRIANGEYEMTIDQSGDIFWVTSGHHFADGIYEVEAKRTSGILDNGFGMLFRVDTEQQRFYMFKVSSDGYVFIGRCDEGCTEVNTLVANDWFASSAVNQGEEDTNVLRVVASGSEMSFFVNGEEVGQASDEFITQGDIGLIAETFAPGGLQVAFDNFSVTPLE